MNNDDNTKAAAIKVAGSIVDKRLSEVRMSEIGAAAALIVHTLNKELARLEKNQ